MTCAIVEGVALAAVAFATLSHIQTSADFEEAMSGILVGILAIWALAWGIPDGLSMFDRSIERHKKVFERSD